MRAIGRVVIAAFLVIVAIWALQLVVGLIFGAIALALRLAVYAALIAGGVWAYRAMTSRGGRRRSSLGGGSSGGSLDMQYLRGKIDKETYTRRKALER